VSARNQLETLEASALISLVRQQPELEYWFRHVLVQEAAYTSLLHADRRRLHRIVAQTLEHLYADRLDGYAALPAQHFHEAADDEKTVEYAARAGDAAARSFAHPEARGHYARALEALSRLPATADNGRRQVDTILKQVGVSLRAEGPEQSLARLQDAEALLNRFADQGEPTHSARLRRARVHFWMGHACVHGGRERRGTRAGRASA
jgi:predicted ATPase